jgi:ribose transport system substrate-binding protein
VGMSKAIVDAGRAGNMVVVGGEGTAPAMDLIRNDLGLNASPSAYDNGWSAWAAMDELNRLFNHQPFVPEGFGMRMVDKTHNLPPSGEGYTTPVPYQADYERIWG